MQHTEKYKLNLIESSDPFLPDALNENTRKLEQAVSQHLDGMDQRIAVFEAKKFVYGSYMGTGARQTISLGFTPVAVIITGADPRVGACVMSAGYPLMEDMGGIVEGGFFVRTSSINSTLHNYLAFG